MSFGTNVAFLRKMHNQMTQEELAEKLNVSRQTVSKWELDGAYPEMDKAIVLSELFNCSMDELFKDNLDSNNRSYGNIRVEMLDAFRYMRYAVVSPMPEDDATEHMMQWAKQIGITQPNLIGWNFPYVSQEQTNVFHMHGYCVACILPDDILKECKDVILQPKAKYVALTIENPFKNPFGSIPNAYTTLYRYMEVNALKEVQNQEEMTCFEKVYEKDNTTYMDIYLRLM